MSKNEHNTKHEVGNHSRLCDVLEQYDGYQFYHFINNSTIHYILVYDGNEIKGFCSMSFKDTVMTTYKIT